MLTRHALVDWQKLGTTNSNRAIKNLKLQLLELHSNYPRPWEEIRQIELKLKTALQHENDFWQTRARINWDNRGDRNTSFFQRVVKNRAQRNFISSLTDSLGTSYTSEADKQRIAISYFEGLFTSEIPPGFFPSGDLPHFHNCLVKGQELRLTAEVTTSEIRKAFFTIGRNQAPGSDGFTGAFFQSFWPIVGPEATKAVLNFFTTGIMLKNLNHTVISLIPKTSNPTSMTHLRPISLCQVVYKVIAKILATRLATVIPSLIGSHQTGFVRDRRITDNIMIAHEIMHFLKNQRKGNTYYFALKLDMEKAFDRVEWELIYHSLDALGFPPKFSAWIKACISTVSYSINLNGKRCGFFKPSRGLRQGDPLSPLLFAICSEVLSRLFHKAIEQHSLRGIKISRHSPAISHLFFADDSFIFLEAQPGTDKKLKDLLDKYQFLSGQKINLHKSAIYFSKNTPLSLRSDFASSLGVGSIGTQDRYLGLPTLFQRSKNQTFKFLEDKLRTKLAGWKGALLSQAGKEVLIKSIASTFPIYTMACFKLPVFLCKKFDSLIANFWWGKQFGRRPIHWVAWSTLTQSKLRGGLGFRNFYALNQALLAKQGWYLLSNPNSLAAKVLKGKYYPHSTFLQAKCRSNSSPAWKSLCFGATLLRQGAFWQFGNGESFCPLQDNWLLSPRPTPASLLHPHNNHLPPLSDFHKHGIWLEDKLQRYFSPRSVELIRMIPLPKTRIADKLTWACSPNGNFSVNSAYHLALDNGIAPNSDYRLSFGPHICDDSFWKTIWGRSLPPKLKIFLWKIFTNSLPLNLPLSTRISNVQPSCPVCSSESESREHLFLNCWVTKACLQSLPIQVVPVDNLSLFWLTLIKPTPPLDPRLLDRITFLWWRLWKNRNDIVFNHIQWTPASIIRKATQDYEGYTYSIRQELLHPPSRAHMEHQGQAQRWLPPPPPDWLAQDQH
ncbi:LINE-1 retrotransposable element ORF2 protein [Linum grandiflorum]